MDRRSHLLDDWSARRPAPLDADEVHVWRIALDDESRVDECWPLLSAAEQAKASRFYREVHRRRYVVAHGTMRTILAHYLGEPADSLAFVEGAHGKPSLIRAPGASRLPIEFNLSHSDELALVAVALGRPVGVDLERWSPESEHLELAERFFSPSERDALRALAGDAERLIAGFFAAWSRKEAYLKATGDGITRGLHHFDVSLAPDEPARLLEDRLDPAAAGRWTMQALAPADGFSAALVATAPLREVRLYDARLVRAGGALEPLLTGGRAP